MAAPWEKYGQQSGPWAKYLSTQPAPEPVTAGEMASDVAKSAGIGLVQGGIGLATLPGNLEGLGRSGVNAAAGMVGLKPVVAPEPLMPDYNWAKGKIESVTGKFYEPKTTAGQYARTFGEFAPLAIGGPATLGAKAARVAAPAVTSETLGQVTEGTGLEPFARAAGALVGTRLPNATRSAATPNPITPTRALDVQTLEKEGVKSLTAGQKTGSKPLRWGESVAADTPFGGGKAVKMEAAQAEELTRAALRKAGIAESRVTPDVINKAYDAIGNGYQRFGSGVGINPQQAPRLTSSLQKAFDEYYSQTPKAMQVPAVEMLVKELGDKAAKGMTGPEYLSYRSAIVRLRRNLGDDWQASRAVGKITDALDAAMARSAPKELQKQTADTLRSLNERYKNLLIIEKASKNSKEGLLTPDALKNAIGTGRNLQNYTRNRNQLAPLARAGSNVMAPLPQSGTGPRSYWQTILSGGGAGAGAMINGPEGAIVGAMAPVVAQAIGSRVLMSGPMQKYLANQKIPYRAEPQSLRGPAALAAMLLNEEQAQSGVLRGSQMGQGSR